MGFTSLVGHVSRAHKVVEHGVVGLRQHHRHLDGERAVAGSHGLALGHCLIGSRRTDDSIIVVPIVGAAPRPPPHRTAAHHLIFHLGLLHGNTGIGTGLSLDVKRVAVLVVVLHLVELHLERRPLVFFHAEAATTILTVNMEQARKAAGGQYELGRARSVLIGCHRLLGHILPVGIIELQRQFLVRQCLMLKALNRIVVDGGHMHRLSGTIDGTVGEHLELYRVLVTFVVVEVVVDVHPWTGLVRRCVGIDA